MLEEELGLSPHVLGRGIFQGQHHINGLLESTDAQLKEDLALLVRGLLCGVFLLLLLCTWRVYDCTVCVCGWVGGWLDVRGLRHKCALLSSPSPVSPLGQAKPCARRVLGPIE